MEERSHILIVDDEPDIRQVLHLLLQSGGYAVSSADNGRTAIDFVSSHPDVDLVLLDIMMPGLSGFEIHRRFRFYYTAKPYVLSMKCRVFF